MPSPQFGLFKEGTAMCHTLLDPQNGVGATDSTSLHMYCDKGDQVWVEANWAPGDNTILNSIWNYFSGVLVHEATPPPY